MLRWLGIVVALALVSAPADAQVFKPKSKKAAATSKAPQKKAAKKQPRAAATKKRVAKKKKKAPAAAAADDDETESEPKASDKDYVKIWDDEEIE